MRKIIKGEAPRSLVRFKRDYPDKNYSFLDGQEHASIRRGIREACLKEQCYLCAYCCVSLDSVDDCHNEHIIPKDTHEGANKSLDFNNIVASCNSNKHCGHYKNKNILPISPLDDRFETEFEYQLSGQIRGESELAKETVEKLNLNYKGLIHQRKDLIDTFIYTWEEDINDLKIEKREFIYEIIDELQGQQDGRLESFFPVILNFINKYYNLST